MSTLKPLLKPNDRVAKRLIWLLSAIVFLAVVLLDRIQVNVDLGFDVHLFAKVNAIINSTVSILLVLAFIAVRQKRFVRHKNLMFAAIILSALFLISYIGHHLFAGDTRFGGEGFIRPIYYFVLITHIILAALILPFILFTAYRSLTGEYDRHKRLARYTFPLWLYVSISGVAVYLMIAPYYGT